MVQGNLRDGKNSKGKIIRIKAKNDEIIGNYSGMKGMLEDIGDKLTRE